MLSITLNPGFVLVLAALCALATPNRFASMLMAGASLVALWLLLDHEFGAAAAIAQTGVPVVLLDLDALNRIFGIAMLLAVLAIAAYSGGRRHRIEGAAILLLAGGAISALFVGDLVSFLAATSLAGLAAAWVVFCSPLADASRAGARLLIWHGIEGLLLLVGAALHLASNTQGLGLVRLSLENAGGASIFAALMIRSAAPFAHVWLKDSVGHASPTGAAALSALTTMIGIYAAARFFPAEPLLIPIGGGMVGVGAFFAAAEADLRRAGAYALMAQSGLCVALIGVGSPLALAAAEGHAFSVALAFLTFQMAVGVLLTRTGEASLPRLEGVSRAAPLTTVLILIAGFAASSAPGFATYATHAVAMEALAQWEVAWLWAAAAALPAILFVALAVRPAAILFRQAERGNMAAAPFEHVLGTVIGCFFCLVVGLAPQWLYQLMPAQLEFGPFASERLGAQLQILGAAGGAFIAVRALGLTAAPAHLLDVDSFYRGPVAQTARWAGILLLRAQDAWTQQTRSASAKLLRALSTALQRLDRPYQRPIGLAPLASAAVVLGFLAASLLIQ